MRYKNKPIAAFLAGIFFSTVGRGQTGQNIPGGNDGNFGLYLVLIVCIVPLVILIGYLYLKFNAGLSENRLMRAPDL